jgi:hypothetical protein
MSYRVSLRVVMLIPPTLKHICQFACVPKFRDTDCCHRVRRFVFFALGQQTVDDKNGEDHRFLLSEATSLESRSNGERDL